MDSGVIATQLLHTSFTVPANETWLVKSIYGYSGAGTAGRVLFHFSVAGGPNTAWFALATSSQQAFRWDGWIAFDPGSRLVIQNVSDGNLTFYVSGSKLPGAAPPTSQTKPT